MKRRTLEEKYKYNIRKQEKTLEDYSEHEFEWAEHLIKWYQWKKEDMPDDEYRACAFFINREYKNKPGSLTLLYQMFVRCYKELPDVTKENAFDILRFRFKMYTKTLEKGGYSKCKIS
jgi:hypothetical protein